MSGETATGPWAKNRDGDPSPVPVFASGTEAILHGLAEPDHPGPAAGRVRPARPAGGGGMPSEATSRIHVSHVPGGEADGGDSITLSLGGTRFFLAQPRAIDMAQDVLAMADAARDRCLLCRWWGRGGGSISEANRQCRRFPPTRSWGGEEVETGWPWTNRDDWCGEFRMVETTRG